MVDDPNVIQDILARMKRPNLKLRRSYETVTSKPSVWELDDKTCAYVAGLFDGEAALCINSDGRSYQLRLSWDKTNYDILKFVSDILGGNVKRVKAQPQHRYLVWEWHLNSEAAHRVLKKLYPFLRIQRDKASICIEFFERYWQGRSTKPVSPERQAIGAEYYAKLQELQSKPGAGKVSKKAYSKVKKDSLPILQEHVQPHTAFRGYVRNEIVLPELELAYIGGLLDVESSFLIYKLSRRPSYLLEVNYRKTDSNILQYLANIYGGRVRPAPLSSKNRQDIWLWKVVSLSAISPSKEHIPLSTV